VPRYTSRRRDYKPYHRAKPIYLPSNATDASRGRPPAVFETLARPSTLRASRLRIPRRVHCILPQNWPVLRDVEQKREAEAKKAKGEGRSVVTAVRPVSQMALALGYFFAVNCA